MAITPGTDVTIQDEPLPRGPIVEPGGGISRQFFNWFQGKDRKLGEIISGVNLNRQNIVQLEVDYQAADGTLSNAYIAADAVVFANSEASNAALSTTLTAAYQSADTALQGQITTNAGNITTAQADITTLFSTTATNGSAISTLQTNLSAEVTNRTNADTALQGQITTNAGNISTNTAAISTEATARASGDAANATSITNLNARIVTSGGLFATRPASLSDYTVASTGAPETVADLSSVTVVNVTGEGDVIESTIARFIRSKAGLPVIPGHTYRVTVRTACTVDGTNNQLQVGFRSLNADWSAQTVHTTVAENPHTVSDGWQTYTYERTTAQILATDPDAAYVASRVAICINAGGTTSGATVQVALIQLEDITDAATNAADITTLQSTTATNTSAIATLTTNLSAEVTNRTNADTSLQGQITTNAGNITTNAAAITTEATARASGDSANASSITSLTAVVNAKNQTFVQTSAPTAVATGDLWVDSDDDNKLYRWNGSSWVAVDDGRIATKSRTFAQNSAPTATATGDLWVDTDDDNKLYRWNGSSWVAVDDQRIGTLSASVTNIAEAYATNDSATARLVWKVNTSTNAATIEQTAATGYSDGTWNGSAIKLSANLIELLAEDINFGTNTTYEDTYATLYTEKNNKRLRILGPFPAADDLVLWFGPTTVSLNSETKTNGHFCLATDGKIYLGSAELTNSGNLDFTYTNGFVKTRNGNGTVTTDSVSFTGSGGSGSGYTFAHELIVTYTTGPTVTLSNTTGSPITASATGIVSDEVRFFVQTTMTDSAGNKVTKSKGGGLFWDI